MPELPEVETIRQSLEEKIIGKVIERVDILKQNRVTPNGKVFDGLAGRVVEKLHRQGKFLLIFLENKVLVIHFMMSGSLTFCRPEQIFDKNTLVIFTFAGGHSLCYKDIRELGRLQIANINDLDSISGLKDLGPEPLHEEFTKEILRKQLYGRRKQIKPLLLDQTFIAGLGNIYVNEILFKAMIHPEKKADTLKPGEVERLHSAIQKIISEAIKYRGTTLEDNVYVDGCGQPGRYQEQLKVYNRVKFDKRVKVYNGEPCKCCGKTLEYKKIGNRGSFFCLKCQKL